MRGLLILSIFTFHFSLSSCSTQKNTALSRSFHQTKTYYNIYYNGRLSYDEGIRQINTSNKDDFAGILNLYPVSNHQAAQSSASKMDLAIEKCRKCIKLHSIKSKPQKINPKRKSDPKYKAWLEQKEFNNKMDLAWMMLGQAEFYKGDFLGSVGTFNYVSRLYEQDKDIVAMCQIWVARAYAEMDWLYEAEDLMQKVNVDDLKRKHRPFYSAVMGDILLKQQRPREALPYVRVGLQSEKKRGYKARFTYVLGQLYQLDHQNAKAKDAYKEVLHLNPAPDLEFNARLHYAELEGDTVKTVKALRRQARLSKNKDRLDRIYGTIGNIFLQKNDTARAMEFYLLAIEKSTQNGPEKAEILILAGDIYYDRHDYKNASPLYSEAIHIITNTHPDYLRVRKLSEVLDEVVVNEDVVTLQDSLQHLATLSEEEQLAIVNRLIEELREQERQDSIRASEEQREAELGDGKAAVNTLNMLGGPKSAAEWYFYNTQLMNTGKQEFQKLWGRRPLEDDWRRLSKAMSSSGGLMTSTEKELPEDEDMQLAQGDSIPSDSTLVADKPEIEPVTDPHDPAYYLQQIPRTEEDFAESNRQIATALINLIAIYRDKVGNQLLSDDAFFDYCRRFPNDTANLVDLYYMQYLNALRIQNDTLADRYRYDIVHRFPNTQQARIVSDPNYFERLRHISFVQDSLYEATYDAFRRAEFRTVKQNTQYAEDSLNLSPLMPRFLFLNAIAKAKTEGQDAFIAALRDMVARYPDSEAGSMARDFLALMNQGSEAQQDQSAMTGLADKRGEITTEEEHRDSTAAFSTERNEPSYALLVMPIVHGTNDTEADTLQTARMNRLLYEVALFNFTQFLIKDFDLMQLPYLTRTECALQVTGLENMGEAEWYIGLIQNNPDLQATFRELQVQPLPITETNYRLLNSPFTVAEYQEFLTSQAAKTSTSRPQRR